MKNNGEKMVIHFYFKLFNNIKSEHEAKDFAKLELLGLFGEVETIRNFFDWLSQNPLNLFTKILLESRISLLMNYPMEKFMDIMEPKINII